MNNVPVAATDFTVTMERSAVMTFANPITQIYHSIFIQNPSETFNYMAYIEPLHYMAWVSIIIFILLAPPLLHFTQRIGFQDSSRDEFTLGKSYVYQLSTLTMRGWSETPTKSTAQIALYSLLFFGTMTYWHWEAMLISYLATRVTVLPFNNIPELIALSESKIALLPGSSYEDAFKTSTDPDWMIAWNDRIKPNIEDYMGKSTGDFVELIIKDSGVAFYDNYFSGM